MSIQLFCIPYAGGKAALFEQLQPYLNSEIELISVEYAGHGTRIKEPFYPDFDAMVKDVAAQINEKISGNEIALFGYSMGSVVAFELLLRHCLSASAVHLFIASHEAPGEHWSSMEYAELEDEPFLKMLTAFGSFRAGDEKRLENRFFQKMIFQPIRADYHLIAQYRLTDKSPVTVPVTMLYAPADVPREAAQKWQARFTEPISFIEIGNHHFFINEQPQAVAAIINQKLQ